MSDTQKKTSLKLDNFNHLFLGRFTIFIHKIIQEDEGTPHKNFCRGAVPNEFAELSFLLEDLGQAFFEGVLKVRFVFQVRLRTKKQLFV